MHKAKIDVPVALIFFNRPEQFAIVFEQVRQARPSKLFLIQDGPREGNDRDVENVAKCREVIQNIDWECEVTKDFSEINLGCGKRVFSGLMKCFEQEDRLIILEDDCVPSQSFFPFCQELLERYKDDKRVRMISGMNHLGQFDMVTDDYLFSDIGSIAGWATWRRSWENVSFDLSKIAEDQQAMRLLKNYDKYSSNRTRIYNTVLKKTEQIKRGEKMSSWSTQFGVNQILQSGLILVPRVNLMTNIGLTAESTNSVGSIKMIPKGLRPIYQLKNCELEFPLKHPKYVINDNEYCKSVQKIMKPNSFVLFYRKIESVWLRLIYGDWNSLGKAIKRRLRK